MSDLATGIASYGTGLFYRRTADSPMFWNQLAGVGDIDGPSRSRSKLDKTSHGTGANKRRFIPGLIDPGEISFPVNYDPDHPTHDATFGLDAMFEEGDVAEWQIWARRSDGTYRVRQFNGFLIDIGEAYPLDGFQTRDVTIAIDGDITELA
jgi:hypothetical protein